MISSAYALMGAGLLCFASMGIIHKLGDRYRAQPLGITLTAMSVAFLVSLAISVLPGHVSLLAAPKTIVWIALPFGASAGLALWLFQRGLRHGHIATSWLVINLSSGIPTVLSLLIYREALTPRKILVFVLVIASLLLLWWDRRSQIPEKV